MNNNVEKTVIEVDECLTDHCHLCTGYYENPVFSSKIICKCRCHVIEATLSKIPFNTENDTCQSYARQKNEGDIYERK